MTTMNWYGGSIAEAVTLSKQKNAIFVVFVEGDNEMTVQMAAAIDDEEVVKLLSNEQDFLAVKLKSGTDNYLHFVRIYQLVPVPSLFFIGRNGTPLEVVGGGIQAGSLAERIDRILQHHRSGSTQPPPSSSQNVKQQSTNLIQAESTPVSVSAPSTASAPIANMAEPRPETSSGSNEYSVVCDGDVCVRVPKDGAGGSGQQSVQESNPPQPTESTASMEEKMRKAKELIEARRLEKLEKEKELERQKELERRSTGQGVAELKRWQQEQEMKQIQEERKREKLENNLARQRILDQIAQDRAERRAREIPATVQQTQENTPNTHTSGDTGASARIQFKLPDGSSHTANFNADDTLSTVYDYVNENLQLSSSSFALWTSFPRRELTELDSTLRTLQLAPSAALLALPRGTNNAPHLPTRYDNIRGLITELLTTYIFDPCRRLLSYIWGGPSAPTTQTPAPGTVRPTQEIAGVRRRTNIHRLQGDRPEEDDNNTWNGNSTQQM